jgi:hypothetical protein
MLHNCYSGAWEASGLIYFSYSGVQGIGSMLNNSYSDVQEIDCMLYTSYFGVYAKLIAVFSTGFTDTFVMINSIH